MSEALIPAQGPVDVVVGLHAAGKRVLDPCCGSRMMWFDRQHPDVVFGDKRTEQHVLCDGRTLRIEPDMLLDFTDLPFDDGTFRLIAFDPPHLHTAGPKSWMAAKYGKLTGDWREDLRKGFSECFRVLASDGVLVFKWNETQVRVSEVLALTPERPLFGHPSGRKGLTHWLVFMKPNARDGDKLSPTEGVKMLGHPITEPIITDQSAWFILYDGQSPDGRGQPQFCGRTTSVRIAKAHFIKCNADPYCTGKVQVVTDREEGYIWRVEDFDQFQRAV